MRRLGRTLLNTAAALSFLLGVAAAALWVRSHFVIDDFQRFGVIEGRLRERRVLSCVGAVAWAQDGPYVSSFREGLRVGEWRHRQYRTGGLSDGDTPAVFFVHQATRSQKAGFVLHLGSQDDGTWYATFMPNALVGLPYWTIALAFAALPAAQVRRLLRALRARRRRAEGRCPACGYDLRASPDRCPECGTFRPVAGTSG